ncbi:hypothetical protein HDU98_010333 [Podochytrium sp. JEL0797]|nr:hypothetical protein HDU98_010333 [Podochytrium sp. JEL0797]
MSDFEHHERLTRALRLAARTIPTSSSSFAPRNVPRRQRTHNAFDTTTFTKPAKAVHTTTNPVHASPTSKATFISGSGSRRTALRAVPLLAEERRPSRLPQPVASHRHSSASLSKPLRSPSPTKAPARRAKSVSFSDNDDDALIAREIALIERELVRRERVARSDEMHELVVPYSVYPDWWGHEEHVPSRGVIEAKKNKKHKVHSRAKAVPAVAAAAGITRGRTLEIRGSNERVVMVDTATETDDCLTEDSEVDEAERDNENSGTESDAVLQKGRRALHRQWIRKENPVVENWKFPKLQVDESIQVNFPIQPTHPPSPLRTTIHTKPTRTPYPIKPAASRSPSPTKTASSRPPSPLTKPQRKNGPEGTQNQFLESSSPTNPRPRVVATRTESPTTKSHHFTIPAHDLVAPKKKSNKKKKENGSSSTPAASAAQSKKRAPREGSDSEKDIVESKKTLLELVYAFLGDEKVMASLDLNVLKDEEDEREEN